MDTYGELKAAIADWMNREDLTTKISEFVDLAERKIYRGLQCEDNEFVASYDNANWRIDGHSDTAVSSGIHLILPPNFRELTLVTWNNYPLDEISKQRLKLRLYRECDSLPRYFCRTGRKIVFSKAMDDDPANWLSTDTLEYTYYGTESLNAYPTWHVATNPVESPAVEDTAPEDLTQTDDNTTRLFQRNPDMYLYGGKYFAAIYLQDDGAAKKYGGRFQQCLDDIKKESRRARFSGSTSSVSSAY